MGEFSLTHWLVILIVLVVIFGPSKLPQLGQSMGLAIKNFKKSIKDIEELPPPEKEKQKEITNNQS